MFVADPATYRQGLTDSHRLAVADVKFAGYGIDALLPEHSAHNLVQQSGDDAPVDQANPALVVVLGSEVTEILVTCEAKITEMEAMRIVWATSKAPAIVTQP